MPTILVIDDDRAVLRIITAALQNKASVITAQNAESGLEKLKQEPIDVLLLDVMLPGADGLELFNVVKQLDPKLPVIFITSGTSSSTAIEAMRMGAYEYLLKPLDLDEVERCVTRAIELRRLRVGVRFDGEDTDEDSDVLVGKSRVMQEVYKSIGRVASQEVAVLILGESGTGKELVARAIYHFSERSDKPFLAVNCAAMTDELLESELFGHEKGAFTGAHSQRIGKFEQCDGGTIFLDEVGDMSPLMQGKVLRLLQQQQFERVGGNETLQTDVRLISATNRDLDHMIEEGTFRQDLYYRLSGFEIDLPPLRDREEDKTLLIEYYFKSIGKQLGKENNTISQEAWDILLNYKWPGNIRELQSVVRHTLLLSTGEVVLPEMLPETVLAPETATQKRDTVTASSDEADLTGFIEDRLHSQSETLYEDVIQMVDHYLLTRVLKIARGNKTKAAELLGITRGSLRHKLKSISLDVDQLFEELN